MGRSPAVIVAAGLPNQPDPAQVGATFLTPLLSTSLSNVAYHVYRDLQTWSNGTWIYYHVKDDNKTTLYIFAAFKRARYQIPHIVVSRAAELGNDCAVIDVTPIIPRGDSSTVNGMTRRPMTIRTTTQTTIEDKPDRLDKHWTPRRFIYGGKRFVWKQDTQGDQQLFEVEREWLDPASKTGKLLDQTNSRRLVLVEIKVAIAKACTIIMVGGLDQMFREYILASVVSQHLIQYEGHT